MFNLTSGRLTGDNPSWASSALVFLFRGLQIFIRRYITRNYEVTCTTGFSVDIHLDLRKDIDCWLYLGRFESMNARLFSECLEDGMVVLDVGANIGFYTLLASAGVGKTGRVYAFEPSEWAMGRLKKNTEDFGRGNVKLLKTGVGDSVKKADLNITADDAYNSLGGAPMKKVIATETIDIVSLDSFISGERLERVDVIKCDTEGADYLVFKGAASLLKKWSPVLFFEFNPFAGKGFPFPPEEVLRLLDGYGYRFFEVLGNEVVEVRDFKPRGYEIIGTTQGPRVPRAGVGGI